MADTRVLRCEICGETDNSKFYPGLRWRRCRSCFKAYNQVRRQEMTPQERETLQARRAAWYQEVRNDPDLQLLYRTRARVRNAAGRVKLSEDRLHELVIQLNAVQARVDAKKAARKATRAS